MAVRFVGAAKGGIGSKGDVDGAINLLVLQNLTAENSASVGSDSQFAKGGAVFVLG